MKHRRCRHRHAGRCLLCLVNGALIKQQGGCERSIRRQARPSAPFSLNSTTYAPFQSSPSSFASSCSMPVAMLRYCGRTIDKTCEKALVSDSGPQTKFGPAVSLNLAQQDHYRTTVRAGSVSLLHSTCTEHVHVQLRQKRKSSY